MPKVVRTSKFNRHQEDMIECFSAGIEHLEAMVEEVKCLEDGGKTCAEYGKKKSKLASIADSLLGTPNSIGKYAAHFPEFVSYLNGDVCKAWKAGPDSYANCKKNYDLIFAALKSDVNAIFVATRALADENIDNFKTMLFTVGEKRPRDNDAADERCRRFASNFRDTKFEMKILYQACDALQYYRQIADRHGL